MTVSFTDGFRPEHRLALENVYQQLQPLLGSKRITFRVQDNEVFDRNPTFRATESDGVIDFNPVYYKDMNTGGVRGSGAHELIHTWQGINVGVDLLVLTKAEATAVDFWSGRWYEGEPYLVQYIYSTEGAYALARMNWANELDRVEDALYERGCKLPPWAKPSVLGLVEEGLVSGIPADEYFGFFVNAPPRLRAAVSAAFRDIPKEIPRALAISFYESRWQEDAKCINCLGVSEHSLGAFQVNMNVHADWTRKRGWDPMVYEDAARIARQLYDWRIGNRQDGWSDWSAARAHGITDTNARTPLPR